MAIDERDRHLLHQRLDDVLGESAAATLMAHLPPVGWLDVTTNQQLIAVEGRLDGRIDALGERMDIRFEALENQMDTRFEALDNQMDTRFEALENQMDARFAGVDAQFAGVDTRFQALEDQMTARFAVVDAKFDALGHDMGERLATGLRDQLRILVFTFVACMVSFASVVIAAVKL